MIFGEEKGLRKNNFLNAIYSPLKTGFLFSKKAFTPS